MASSSAEPGPGDAGAPGDDAVLQALDDLVRAAQQMRDATDRVRERADALRKGRQSGRTYRELVSDEDRPLIAELLTDSIRRFQAAGTRFRQAEAHALHEEGMTLEHIGRLFGLTRQRIAVLLRAGGSRSAVDRGNPGTSP